MSVFKRTENVEILNDAELIKRSANDKYRNDKKISDAIHNVIVMAIYGIFGLIVLGVLYGIYYYVFSPQKSAAAILKISGGLIIYGTGIFTPAIKKSLGE